MPRFIEGQDRHQVTLLPKSLDEFIAEDSAVRVVDAFVDELDLPTFGRALACTVNCADGVAAARSSRRH
jgi:transposase